MWFALIAVVPLVLQAAAPPQPPRPAAPAPRTRCTAGGIEFVAFPRRPQTTQDPGGRAAAADPEELELEDAMECFVEPEEAFTRDEIE